MILKAIAIDDEPLALEILSRHCKKIPAVELVKTFQNPMLGVSYLQDKHIDLMFVDIQMPDLNGLQLLKSLSDPPQVIFTTAYSDYAVDSYELNAVDYVLKPISFERLLKAVNKALEIRKGQIALLEKEEGGEEKKDFLFVKSDTRFFKIFYRDILFVEGMRDYVAIHTAQQRVLTLTSMTNMVKRLPSDMFMRIHKSYIIGLQHISLIQQNRVTINEKEIPISNSYKDELSRYIEDSNA